MKFDWETFSPIVAALAPMVGLILAIILDRKLRGKVEKPPQVEKLLRPPGYSLSLRLDTVFERMLDGMLVATILSCFAGAAVVFCTKCFAAHAPLGLTLLFTGLLVVLVVATILVAIWSFRRFRDGRNIRLGISGEQAVAESLNEAAVIGFRAFHDLEDEKVGNIDHIAVGTRGVFLVETKARRRRASRKGQPEHEVAYNGEVLQFPSGTEAKPIHQAKINAKWLSNFLSKKTGEQVRVEPLVVLPGWFVRITEKGNFPVKVMNANYLVRYLQGQPESIEPVQVRRIIAALDEKCRDVEF